MDVKTLIDIATKTCYGTQGKLAEAMNRSPARISDWKKGHWNPDANEIAFLADKAGLPVIETVAEIESALNPQYAQLWKKAVRELRQNQG
jgi:transcriptional regulator with XRE-family HTH domain